MSGELIKSIVPAAPPGDARAAAEKELRRVTALCDELPTLLAHCDADERYLFVNRAYAETYGRTKDEVLGRRVSEVVPPELYEVIAPRIRSPHSTAARSRAPGSFLRPSFPMLQRTNPSSVATAASRT